MHCGMAHEACAVGKSVSAPKAEVRSSMNLSRRIRDLRYAKGWGPDELASRAKISRTALYQIERGNTSKPQAGTLRRISRALGVPLEDLLEATPVSTGDSGGLTSAPPSPVGVVAPGIAQGRTPPSDRAEELIEKFRLLLGSPLAEGVARIIEESFRLLPIIPPPTLGESSHYASPLDLEPANRIRGRSQRSV
jgi:transcriptional regulator with XRE-family HTH domain